LNQFQINNEDRYADELRTIGEITSNDERRTLQNSKSKPNGLKLKRSKEHLLLKNHSQTNLNSHDE